MIFTTTSQYVVLALALVVGWLFGLASHPGGRKWRARYVAERDAHAAARKEADARAIETNRLAAEARSGHDTAVAAANRRISELEAENARLAKANTVATARDAATPAYAAPVTPIRAVDVPVRAPATMPPVPATAARTYPDGRKRGWFDWR